MYRLLSLLTGVVLAVMIAVNGNLTGVYGILWGTVIIHFVGVIVSYLIIVFKGNRVKLFSRAPLWIYLGGAVGVLTVLFNNYSFREISITSIGALGLLGQMLTSLLIDYFGLFGMQKVKFTWRKLLSLPFAVVGIIIMLDFNNLSAVLAILFSVLSGTSIVLARTINSKLSDIIGALEGSYINHLIGGITSLIIAIAFAWNEVFSFSFNTSLWIYLGGSLGVLVVVLGNVTVPKLSSIDITILAFVGQVLMSAALDIVFGAGINSSFYGGLVISLGIIASLLLAKVKSKR